MIKRHLDCEQARYQERAIYTHQYYLHLLTTFIHTSLSSRIAGKFPVLLRRAAMFIVPGEAISRVQSLLLGITTLTSSLSFHQMIWQQVARASPEASREIAESWNSGRERLHIMRLRIKERNKGGSTRLFTDWTVDQRMGRFT
ncbi:hypothetical protein CBL_10720 [Carabus blaptoides fortunei]